MRALMVAGVLGIGTALVFGAAALTATLFPNGTMVSAGWNGPIMDKGWGGAGIVVPVPMPAPMIAPQILGGDGSRVIIDGSGTLPGDIVVTDPSPDIAPSP